MSEEKMTIQRLALALDYPTVTSGQPPRTTVLCGDLADVLTDHAALRRQVEALRQVAVVILGEWEESYPGDVDTPVYRQLVERLAAATLLPREM